MALLILQCCHCPWTSGTMFALSAQLAIICCVFCFTRVAWQVSPHEGEEKSAAGALTFSFLFHFAGPPSFVISLMTYASSSIDLLVHRLLVVFGSCCFYYDYFATTGLDANVFLVSTLSSLSHYCATSFFLSFFSLPLSHSPSPSPSHSCVCSLTRPFFFSAATGFT